jgi:hypothetical protein
MIGSRVGVRATVVASVLVLPLGALVACDLQADTKYGPHSGLSKDNLPTPPPAEAGAIDAAGLCNGQGPIDAGACSVSYTNDIWPKMSGTWHCTDAKCHGGTSYQPQLADPDNAYLNLLGYTISGKPYVNPCSTDPDASAFVCNIVSPACGTGQMPFPDNTLGSGPMSSGDVGTVTTWVQCGAPKN